MKSICVRTDVAAADPMHSFLAVGHFLVKKWFDFLCQPVAIISVCLLFSAQIHDEIVDHSRTGSG